MSTKKNAEYKIINSIQLFLVNRKIRKDIKNNHELEYIIRKLQPRIIRATKNSILRSEHDIPSGLRKCVNSNDNLIIRYMKDHNDKIIAYYVLNQTNGRTRFDCNLNWYGDSCKIDMYLKAILEKNIGICGNGIKTLMGWR